MTPILTTVLLPAIGEIVQQVIRSPRNDAPPAQAPLIAAEVERQVRESAAVREVAAQVEYATNAEPWYQSRVTIGAIVSIGAGVCGLLGLAVSPQDVETIVAVATAAGTLVGGLVTLYGRWVAKTPLGRR